MKVLVKCNITRIVPVYVSNKFKGVLHDDASLDEMYAEIIETLEAQKADNEYIEDVCAITDAETKKVIAEF